ncbi:hypothetical protein GCM10009332_06150 [Shewanella gelidii]|uniref:Uncharacterized protein n=1 Tax=Shewanella gelidii TaxID=1642821 RepID=A0A917JKP0_9GAMM|nr:hypothetical protein GCM10009332_06150 [Shewanella gelidii]
MRLLPHLIYVDNKKPANVWFEKPANVWFEKPANVWFEKSPTALTDYTTNIAARLRILLGISDNDFP